MTERLYYTDATLTTFEARVVRARPAGDRHAVVLDRTAFYPTSGGQPFDTGRLDGHPVVDVLDADDGTIVHVVAGAVTQGAVVRGEIDWDRRFDHMQQHTGQHLLSAAFDRLFGVRTVSFHLGAEASTIDLARDVAPDEVSRAERAASVVVWEDRPVTVRFADADDAARLPLRKEPARSGRLRLVEAGGFDLSACGGTHVARTGEVGVIAVTAWERFKGGTRVTFVCGRRALDSYARLRDIVAEAARAASVSGPELAAAVERLAAAARDERKRAARLEQELAGHRALAWRAEAETIGACRGVLRVQADADAELLRTLAAAVVAVPGYVVVLVGSGSPAPVVAARSADVPFDAGDWLKQAIARFGGRGGGRPELAQGGIPAAADQILTLARARLAGL